MPSALRKTGMEPDRAKGLACVPGKELGARVAAQSKVDAGLRQVRTDLGPQRPRRRAAT